MMRMQQYEIRCGCGRGEITTENEPCKTGIEELHERMAKSKLHPTKKCKH